MEKVGIKKKNRIRETITLSIRKYLIIFQTRFAYFEDVFVMYMNNNTRGIR